MVEKPALSKSEMEIARILWDIGPASVREVHEAVNEERALDFTTVQTYLRRIETKGYASSRLQGRIRVYTAKTRPKTVIRQTVDDLLQRLFGGEAMPLMRHLIEEGKVDSAELSELRELIDEMDDPESK